MKEKILIVEDDIKISRIIELLLVHEGYETEKAIDGKEALSKLKYNKYDLVLLDIMIPHINGIEVMRKTREFTDIPIIIVSAKDEISDKVIGLDFGANDYITKPFANEELLARIRAALRKNILNTKENIVKAGDIEINMTKYEVSINNEILELSKKEFELLYYMVKNKGIVLSRDKRSGGLGLGLSIVKMITELHGWSVEIFSSYKEGTEVKIKIR